MSINEPEMNLRPEVQQMVASAEQQERSRRGLLLALLLLLLLLCAVVALFIRYLLKPAPLPTILPGIISERINYPPTYKFSITGVDKPVGVAVSPDGQRVYVAEGGGERLIKMFDRDGRLIQSFAPPGTNRSNRKPAYIAVDATGRVFVSEHYNHVLDIFDQDGKYIDSWVARDLTASQLVAAHNDGAYPEGTVAYYDNITKAVYYQIPGEELKSIPLGDINDWSPLGLRFDPKGNLLVTNIVAGKHAVLVYPAASLVENWLEFSPEITEFGEQGQENGQLSFPNSVVVDSRGNYYVSDGNNGRISFWNSSYEYGSFFGFGSSDNALNLPRGMWMDARDRLHVTDAVGQFVRVYDVSKEEPQFLFSFGNFGVSDGLFNYPNDLVIDFSGRLYIADRENNRIQVWSY